MPVGFGEVQVVKRNARLGDVGVNQGGVGDGVNDVELHERLSFAFDGYIIAHGFGIVNDFQ